MNPFDAELDARLKFAVEAGRAAGQSTLEFFQRGNFQVERKSDNSPVTIADRQAEQFLRSAVRQRFPADGFVGEEFGEESGTSGFRWIADPIDGTKSFICGVPLYGTLLGVEHDSRSVIGVIDVPALGECVYAAAGRGAWYIAGNAPPVPARVSDTPLGDGLFVTSQVDSFTARGAEGAFQALQKGAYVTRTWGDCYGYLLVATGRAVVMIDPIMNLWDSAAIQPILEEAGGHFTDWQGRPTIHAGEAIGCNRRAFEEILAITRRWPKPS